MNRPARITCASTSTPAKVELATSVDESGNIIGGIYGCEMPSISTINSRILSYNLQNNQLEFNGNPVIFNPVVNPTKGWSDKALLFNGNHLSLRLPVEKSWLDTDVESALGNDITELIVGLDLVSVASSNEFYLHGFEEDDSIHLFPFNAIYKRFRHLIYVF
ncbi:MAG: hypothetical protein ACTSUE_16885 [Promethearchaeota archaeon]